jgi:hypothetical protein
MSERRLLGSVPTADSLTPRCWRAPRSEAEMAADLAVWHAQRDECLARGPGKVLTIEQKAFYYEHG